MSDDREEHSASGTEYDYGLQEFVAASGIGTFSALNDMIEENYLHDGLLNDKTRQLALLVACIAQGDTVVHLRSQMHAAERAGATSHEILEAINLVSPWIGAPCKIAGLEAWRATFRPELSPIDRLVERR